MRCKNCEYVKCYAINKRISIVPEVKLWQHMDLFLVGVRERIIAAVHINVMMMVSA